MRICTMMLALLFMIGCGEKTPTGKNVPLDQVPPTVMEIAKQKLPNVTFEQAWTTPSGNFEVRGRDKNGKVRDIQLKANGDIVEID